MHCEFVPQDENVCHVLKHLKESVIQNDHQFDTLEKIDCGSQRKCNGKIPTERPKNSSPAETIGATEGDLQGEMRQIQIRDCTHSDCPIIANHAYVYWSTRRRQLSHDLI